MGKSQLAPRRAGRDIVWMKVCMICLKEKGILTHFNPSAKDRETYAEHMEAEHNMTVSELTGRAPNEYSK